MLSRQGLCPGPRQGLCPWTPLGAPPPNPWPAFKKSGGKLAGKLFWFSNGRCWPAAHRERRARLVCGKPGRERGGGWIAWAEENPSAQGGRRLGAKRPERANPGPLAPGSLFYLAAGGRPRGPLPRPAKRRRPPGETPALPPTPKGGIKPGLLVIPATPRPPPGKTLKTCRKPRFQQPGPR